MKVLRLAIRILFVCCLCISEAKGTVLKEDLFLLRGSVWNCSENASELMINHPLRQETYTVLLDGEGCFCQCLPGGGCQDMQCLLFDTLSCMVMSGDTLEMMADMAAKTYCFCEDTLRGNHENRPM